MSYYLAMPIDAKYLLLRTLLINNIQSGKSIFLRSIDNPSLSKQYTSHTSGTTVARFSPSGYYVASGDVSGSVMVWDAVEAVNTKGTRLLLLKQADFSRSARLKH
jgi:WD40 repeat protein